MSLLLASGLTVKAGSRRLIADLNWTVNRGEFWCVLGRNGAGKSSLLNVVAGLSLPAAGAVAIEGQSLATLDPLALAHRRGLMTQHVVDSFSCPVFDAVAIGRTPLRISRGWDDEEDTAVIQEALHRVGMVDRAQDDVKRLSGGERQRVSLASLIAQQVPLMLLDEPTSHQDVAWQVQVMQLLKEASSEHAVIASCHDINLALQFATHLLVLGQDFHWTGAIGLPDTHAVLSRAFGGRFESRPGLFLA